MLLNTACFPLMQEKVLKALDQKSGNFSTTLFLEFLSIKGRLFTRQFSLCV